VYDVCRVQRRHEPDPSMTAHRRVLLINPPAPDRLGAPLLSQQYLAAALARHGCEVRVIDAAARRFEHDVDWIAEEVERFAPHLLGVSLNTRSARQAYRLVDRLAGPARQLVAGGPHATACPKEPLAHGFDVCVAGEAEETIVCLIDALELGRSLEEVSGIYYRAADGELHATRPRAPPADLDALASPLLVRDLFDPKWYAADGTVAAPGGILTSRGCPARCSFCANYVKGRDFRYRSACNVLEELRLAHRLCGATFFPCWDDALTAHPARLLELCATLESHIDFDLSWSAIARADQVTPELLHAMRRAGLQAINFGVESGDDQVLRQIGKGITTEQVVQALEWSKAEGLVTTANFMLGFPEETPAALQRTLHFMHRIAPMVDNFSTLGVVVPLPGTPLYEAHHAQYGFTDWWLREDYLPDDATPPIDDIRRFRAHYVDDATLALDFFKYGAGARELIRECLRFKGEHNLSRMGLGSEP
jgi:radical SAM superfamily enzyme YgiQ (UPF0313 family)